MHPAAIGPFTIERELGRGGMGEVFLARDTRLDRLVAIKALPAHLAQDPDRLARFQREAKVLASLNHPGIAAIYGLEEANGHQYLVLEFVDGQTLADRLTRGPLPLDEVLHLARQIADALEVAHEKGVVHRDLKPGNIMLTADGATKVLDFGLARAAEGSSSISQTPASADSPTITSPARFANSPTIPGVIMGTAGYMSPEQARGKPVDKRSDIFSFGCVLYEMLTGAQPFRGETVADAIGATLHKETDLGALPPGTPRRVRELLANCLAKDRRNRLHDMGDARIELERALASPPDQQDALQDPRTARRGRRTLTAVVLASVAVIAAAVAVIAYAQMHARTEREQREAAALHTPMQVVRFTIQPPAGYTLPPFITQGTGMAVSPTNDRLVFVAESNNQPHLCVRDFASSTSRVLPGTEGCRTPFFSPDGKWIGCLLRNRILKMPAEGGPALTLCECSQPFSFAWLDDGTIVWGGGAAGLWRVSAEGGTPQLIVAAGPDTKPPEGGLPALGFGVPLRIPGADYFLCGAWDGPTTESFNLLAVSLKDGSLRMVMRAANEPRLIAPDRLLFTRGTTVMSVGFDPKRGVTVGDATVALEGVRTDMWGDSAYLDASAAGSFAYVPGGRFGSERRLVRVDETGKVTPLLDQSDVYSDNPRISPDGRKVAITTLRRKLELWAIDLDRRSMSLVSADGEIYAPIWTRDGAAMIAQHVTTQGNSMLGRWTLNGSGDPVPLPKSANNDVAYFPAQELPDGSGLLLQTEANQIAATSDIEIYDYATSTFRPVRNRPAAEGEPCVSPDGTMLAYVSDQSGRREVYVGPLNGSEPDIQVSVNGGYLPRFSPDGKRLNYMDLAGKMIAADLEVKPSATMVAKSGDLFDAAKLNLQSGGRGGYAVFPDGSFLMIERAPWESEAPVMHVILNWAEELAAKAPAKTSAK